jgi:hypothetical protein
MNCPDDLVLVERESPYHYTQSGLELKELTNEAIVPIFIEFMRRGFSPYQICAVVHDKVAEVSREIVSVHKTAGKEAADKMLENKLKPQS